MKTKWQLEIYPKEQKITKKGTFEDYVGMYLRYKGKVNKVMAGYNVDTINSAGKERESFKIKKGNLLTVTWTYWRPGLQFSWRCSNQT